MAMCDDDVPSKRPKLESVASKSEEEDYKEHNPLEETKESHSEKSEYLREEDVGITEYISSHEGFSGILKQRYSDFLVREIDLEGQIVKLSTITAPEDKVQEEKSASSADENVLTQDMQDKLRHLSESKDCSAHIMLKEEPDKEARKTFHNAIKSAFPMVSSETITQDGNQWIRVSYGKSGDFNRRKPWPKDRGDFTHFTLYKENKDTMDAVNLIAKFLRTKPGNFTYAGTKDRRAKTCQLVSLYKMPADTLTNLNKKLRNVAVGDIRYCKHPLKLGDLRGNNFVIVLRNVTGSNEQIAQAMESLQAVGFIHYYGMQRFGTTSVPTHQVGRSLLQSNWSEAIDLILKPRHGDIRELDDARKTWWETRDPKLALQKLGNRHGIEQQLLRGLCKCHQNDHVGALGMIARNSRLMYIHSYQSYIWNTIVSRRLKEFGLKTLVGDLVIRSKDLHLAESEDSDPVVVTEDHVDKYTIQDVVMPLPGHDVMYPQNEINQWYQDMLSQDGLQETQLKHKIKDYSLPGAYRHVIVKPQDVKWEVVKYDDVTVPLALSDLDALNGMTLPDTDGNLRALKLEFSLPPSAYATMALREVLKEDTSAAHQSTLNSKC